MAFRAPAKREAELDRPARDRLVEVGASRGGVGEWVVDCASGSVHARPALSARDRELIIVARMTTLGSSDPQVSADIRALRAIDDPWQESEETILQTAPYAGVPRA